MVGTCVAPGDDASNPHGGVDLGAHFGIPRVVTSQRLSGDQYGPSLTSDQLTMFTSGENMSDETDIYESQSTSMVFSTPLVVSSLADVQESYDPEVTVDGSFLLFDSPKVPEGIWYAVRSGTSYTAVQTLLAGKHGPGLADGDARLFCTDLTSHVFEEYDSSPQGVSMLRTHEKLAGYEYPSGSQNGLEVFTMKDHQLYRATRATLDDQFGAPEKLTFDAYDFSQKDDPEISSDGKTLYFSMKNPDSLGFDTYMATR